MSCSQSPTSFNPNLARANFEIFDRPSGRIPLAYLDNGATTQRPRRVLDALHKFDTQTNSNVHRGVHALSQLATEAFEEARAKVSTFINAASPAEVVFTPGTTAALNLVSRCCAPLLKGGPGGEILLTEMEHHSNIVPWQRLSRKIGAELVIARVGDDAAVSLAEFASKISSRTRLVALTHVSNVLGSINPVRDVARLAKEHGALVVVDGAQGVPHLPVDVQDLGCDFYAFSGHKVYGPTGSGALWGRSEHLATMPPDDTGGGMIEVVSFSETTFAPPPQRFEAGTPNISGAIGLGAALDFVDDFGRESIAAHEASLCDYAVELLGEIPEVTVHSVARHRAAVVSFSVAGVHPHDVGTVLDHRGVAVRAGHHCAQPLIKRLGVSSTVRASFALYNTRDDVDRLADGVRRSVQILAAVNGLGDSSL